MKKFLKSFITIAIIFIISAYSNISIASKEIDVNLKGLFSWIKNRLVKWAKTLLQKIREAVNKFFDRCEQFLDNI